MVSTTHTNVNAPAHASYADALRINPFFYQPNQRYLLYRESVENG
jgi:hypothetical protein